MKQIIEHWDGTKKYVSGMAAGAYNPEVDGPDNVPKYYKPTLDEFYLGFEYERLESVLIDKGWHKVYEKQWVPKVADKQYIVKYYGAWEFMRDLEDDLIRVKCLDKADIEELGFKHVGGKLLHEDHLQDFVKDLGRLYIHLKWTKFTNLSALKIEVSVEKNSVRTLVIHSIGIKNKSELKKVLKMCNLYE